MTGVPIAVGADELELQTLGDVFDDLRSDQLFLTAPVTGCHAAVGSDGLPAQGRAPTQRDSRWMS